MSMKWTQEVPGEYVVDPRGPRWVCSGPKRSPAIQHGGPLTAQLGTLYVAGSFTGTHLLHSWMWPFHQDLYLLSLFPSEMKEKSCVSHVTHQHSHACDYHVTYRFSVLFL